MPELSAFLELFSAVGENKGAVSSSHKIETTWLQNTFGWNLWYHLPFDAETGVCQNVVVKLFIYVIFFWKLLLFLFVK